ncbi:MAG: hypothetical protein Q8P60_06030 [Pseudorhodobacter sp.]|nr:hypothetical protein [Pseudorhodobacter sp.]
MKKAAPEGMAVVPIFNGWLFGCGGDQRGVNVNPAVGRAVGKGRREHGLFQLAKPRFHAVGFLADGDRVLHVGHVVGREGFKGIGHKAKPPVVANARQEARPGADSPRNVNIGANHLQQFGRKIGVGAAAGTIGANYAVTRLL